MYTYCECSNKEIDVDIMMPAYNHGKYIGQAIESVINQKTRYKYRILIGEDASTDNTRDIVIKYYNKYPDKIALVLWEHNVGGAENSIQLSKLSEGKYFTILEGDDYWTDSLKLEKQISFLEKHKEYIGTAHNVRCVDEKGDFLPGDISYPIQEEHIYGKQQALKFELVAQTASLVCRNFWNTWDEQQYKAYMQCTANGDLKNSVYLGMSGEIFYFRDIMSDHRRVFEGDSWTAKTHDKNLLEFLYRSQCEIKEYIENVKEMPCPFVINYKAFLQEALVKLFCDLTMENFKVFLKLLVSKRKK